MHETIRKLRDTIDELSNADINAVDWAYKVDPAKWSKKEIIGHLIDSAQINLQRFVRCTYEDGFKLTYEQVEWVRAQHYQEADIAELLGLWRLLNLQIIRVLINYPANTLLAECDNSKIAVSMHSIEWLAEDYLEHLRHHLKQIY